MSLSLMSGAPAAIGELELDMPSRNNGLNHEVILGEEEISDVSMATFYLFDKEKSGFRRAKFAMGAGCACWTGVNYGTPTLRSDAIPTRHSIKPVRKSTHRLKRTEAPKGR